MIKAFGAVLTILFGGVVVVAGASSNAAFAQTATALNCKGCVKGKQLGNNAVTKKKIKDRSVNAKKLAGDAKPAGADSVVVSSGPTLNGTAADIVKFNVKAPDFGYIVATATGNVSFDGTVDTITCGFIDTGVTSPISVSGASGDSTAQGILNQTTMFPAIPGNNKIIWRCATNTQPVTILNAEVVAIFVPNKY